MRVVALHAYHTCNLYRGITQEDGINRTTGRIDSRVTDAAPQRTGYRVNRATRCIQKSGVGIYRQHAPVHADIAEGAATGADDFAQYGRIRPGKKVFTVIDTTAVIGIAITAQAQHRAAVFDGGTAVQYRAAAHQQYTESAMLHESAVAGLAFRVDA